MKKEKKEKVKRETGFWFYFLLILILIIDLFILEICKNRVYGWLFSIVFVTAFLGLHHTLLKGKKKFYKFLSWVALIAMFVVTFYWSAPTEKRLSAVDCDNPKNTSVVEVQQGKLMGVYNEDESVKVYAGIPYAQAPVGDLRWKEPQAAESWSGIKICDTFAPMAMQNRNSAIYSFLTSTGLGYNNFKISTEDNYVEARSEDCLYLNVWTPSDCDDTSNLPVLVYIHGGSLTGGQSYYSDYNGEALAKKGVIVVTIAYRVGIFGYMASDELAAESENGTTGNYGLLDQIAALQWVNDNISSFGGDASNITLAGESAGASSVNALCVSPLAKGLFKRVIAESSGITAVQPYHTFRTYQEALEDNKDVLEEFNCKNIDELRKVSAEDLLKSSAQNNAMTVDGYAITEQPYKTYESGNNNEEAVLGGFNADEGYVFTMFGQKPKLSNYHEFLEKFAGDYADELEELYPATTDKEAQENYTELAGTVWFGYSHYKWSQYVTNNGGNAYLYNFTRDNKGLGVWHSGELPYFYGNLFRNPQNYNDRDYELSEQIQNYIVNYCKSGDPNGSGLPTWKTYGTSSSQLMNLGDTTKMVKDKYLKTFEIIDKYQDSLKSSK